MVLVIFVNTLGCNIILVSLIQFNVILLLWLVMLLLDGDVIALIWRCLFVITLKFYLLLQMLAMIYDDVFPHRFIAMDIVIGSLC